MNADDWERNRFKFVHFECKELYYDALEGRYVCASSGSENKTAGHCKRCPKLRTVVSDTPFVDLR